MNMASARPRSSSFGPKAMQKHGKLIRLIHSRLSKHFGRLDWWPAETKDEIIIGAILTQNTNWSNVEKALSNLRNKGLLDLKSISSMRERSLARLIRPSGFYNQKAKRLGSFSKYIFSNYGSLDIFFSKDTLPLRNELLSLDGIGMETADSILLYAAEKPIFVIDAYTRRITKRVLGLASELDYQPLQTLISSNTREEINTYKEFHAQFVQLAKNNCRKVPICPTCPLSGICNYHAKA